MPEATDILILHDGDGTYYLLPGAVMEAARVPAEDVPSVKEALGEGDVDGFTFRRVTASWVGAGAGSELNMINLQSLLSQRQTAIQLTINMLASLNDSTKTVAKNIGG